MEIWGSNFMPEVFDLRPKLVFVCIPNCVVYPWLVLCLIERTTINMCILVIIWRHTSESNVCTN